MDIRQMSLEYTDQGCIYYNSLIVSRLYTRRALATQARTPDYYGFNSWTATAGFTLNPTLMSTIVKSACSSSEE